MLAFIGLELKKIKRTFMNTVITWLSILPVILIVVQYLSTKEENKVFFTTVANNNAIISMGLYTILTILTNFIFAREYQDKTYIYLFISPQSRKKILIGKYAVIFLGLFVLGGYTYGITLLLNALFGNITTDIVVRMLGAWLIGGGLFFLLVPFIVTIALWRKNFISSMLISLVLLIFTTPFIYTNNFYAFPHLIPMAVATNFLRIENKMDINYGLAMLVLIVVFTIFSFISVKLFEQKE